MNDNSKREETLVDGDIHIATAYRLTEALIESEQKLRRRIEFLREVIFETDANGNLVFLNGSWSRCLGYPADKSLGLPLCQFVIEEDRSILATTISRTSLAESDSWIRVRFRRDDGEIVWMEVSASPLPEGGVVGALHDVTGMKSSEDELAKLSLVATYTENMVVITDAKGRTEWVNQAFMNRTGYTLEDLVGLKPGEILQGPATDPNTVAKLRQWLAEGESFKAELINYTRAREPYWVSFYVTPIRNSEGKIERYVSIQTDTTEAHRTQQELKEAKERAESGNRAKSQFLATISHEMRTPLNVILGSTDIILDKNFVPEELPEHLKRIEENGEGLLRLITDLLDLTKIESGHFDFEKALFFLRTSLSELLRPLAERAQAKHLEFQIHFDEKLPAQIVGDEDRIRQIVTNLVVNAIKFTENGSVRVEISIQDQDGCDGQGLEIRVVDTGVGIAPDDQERIFERFEQVDGSVVRRRQGAGLGLNIVKSLVDGLGGHVTLRSKLGEGSDFRVFLPLEAKSEAPAQLPSKPEQSSSVEQTQQQINSARILVVEDTEANYTVFSIFLTKAGYKVERANSGWEAIENFANSDLILMDIGLPEIDGLETTRRIREVEKKKSLRHVPILALTAHVLPGYRESCLEAGCSGYLTKPIRRQTLLDAVRAALDEQKESCSLSS